MRFPLLLLSTLVGSLLQAAPIRIVGSDLLSPVFERGLAAYAARDDQSVTVKLEGSGIGLTLLRQEKAELGLLVFPPDSPRPSSEEFVSLPVAYYTAVLAVRNSIPVNQLTFAQIGGIYGDAEKSNHRRWGDIGGSGPWATRSILATAITRQGSLAFDLLRAEVLKTNRIKPTVIQMDTPEELITRIKGDEGGIAVLPLPPGEASGLKVLLVSSTEDGVAYPPTSDNINNGDYPLRMPLYLVFRKSDATKLGPVLRFLLGENALPLWTQAGLISAPVQARNQLIFDLEVM